MLQINKHGGKKDLKQSREIISFYWRKGVGGGYGWRNRIRPN